MKGQIRGIVFLLLLGLSIIQVSGQSGVLVWRTKIPIAERLIQQEQFDPALRLLEEIHAEARKVEDCYWEGWSALWLGEAHYQLGHKQKAIDISLLGKEKVDRCLDPDTIGYYVQLCQNIGVFYSSIGDYNRQMEYYRLAFEQALKTHGWKSESMADAYFNLGAAFGRREYWEQCIVYIDTSLQISRAIEYRGGEASALHNLAFAYSKKRDFRKAIDLQEEALRLTELKEEKVKGYKNLGQWYVSLGDPEHAFEYFDIALQYCYAVYPPDSDNSIDILQDMAVAHWVFGNEKEAKELVNRALEYLEESSGKDLNLKQTLNYKARIWSQTGDWEEAMRAIEKAIRLRTGAISLEARAFLIKGNLLGEAGQVDEGIRLVHQALQTITPGFSGENPFRDNPRLDQIQNYDATLEILEAKGALIYEKGVNQLTDNRLLGDALSVYKLADSLSSKMHLLFQDTRTKSNLRSGTLELYNGAIQTCEKLYRRTGQKAYLDLAFQFVEKNKFQLVAESLNSLYMRDFTGVPLDLIKRERDLISEIEFFSNVTRWGEAVDQEDDRLAASLAEKRKELDSIWATLKSDFAQYYNMRQSLDFSGIEQVRMQVIGEGEIGLEYFLGKEYIYAFLLNKEGKDLISWPKPQDLDQMVSDFRESILNQDDSYWTLGHQLYQVLLEPIEEEIRGKNLCLITDGVLSFLPFETLLTQPVAPPYQGLRDKPFLIQQVQVRYLLSGQVGLLAELQTRESFQQKGEILGMAPSFEKVNLAGEAGRQGGPLMPLEGALQEVELLSQRFHGLFLTGKEATKKAFLNNASQFSVLHIATHTLIDDESPAFSRLVFAREEGIPDEYELRNHEIYGLTLNADLVILSACNTGMGVFRKGEGPYSLGRAFAFAGSPNLIMTLWPVKDKTTAYLMQLFYANLERGMNKPDALNEAKRTYLADYSSELLVHPYYWGGLLYSGDDDVLELKEKYAFGTRAAWAGVMIGALLLGFGITVRQYLFSN